MRVGVRALRMFSLSNCVSGYFRFQVALRARQESPNPGDCLGSLAVGEDINIAFAGNRSSIPRKSRP